jgi:1-deoxy-D-xylulose-5-phosphate reductoisomerase
LITFTDIVEIVSASVDALRSIAPTKLRDLSDVSAIEEDARRTAYELVKKVGA